MKNLYTYIELKLLAAVCVSTNSLNGKFVKTRIWAFISIALTISLSACAQSEPGFMVNHQGVLREIMMEQKIGANANLSAFKNTPHLYALGALEGLSGEVLILDGQPLNGLAKEGKLTIDRSFDKKATLLVSSEVAQWKEVLLDLEIASLKDIESIVPQEAIEAGIDTRQAFPFMIKGSFELIDWHVINAAEATEQNHEAYKKAGLKSSSNKVTAQILGFYSEKHEGIFTHHGSFLHMHFINEAETEMGHVDNLKISGSIKLMLPKIDK